MHYQIYLPELGGAHPDRLRQVGLGELVDAGGSLETIDVVENGPDGGRGTIFFWQPCELPGHHPDRQLWTKAKPRKELPAGRYWLGRDTLDPPRPADMLRADNLGGELAELADGQRWLIPIARKLPHGLTIGDDGLPRRKVKPQYESFFNRSHEYFQLMLEWVRGDAMEELTVPAAWTFALDALRFNYRVNSDIVDWLGLLDDRAILRLIGASNEIAAAEAMLEMEKKNCPAMSGT